MDFRINYEDLEQVASQCKINASKPVDALKALANYYNEIGEQFPPFQKLAEKLKEAEANAGVIEEAYLATAKTFEEYAEQGRRISGAVN